MGLIVPKLEVHPGYLNPNQKAKDFDHRRHRCNRATKPRQVPPEWFSVPDNKSGWIAPPTFVQPQTYTHPIWLCQKDLAGRPIHRPFQIHILKIGQKGFQFLLFLQQPENSLLGVIVHV